MKDKRFVTQLRALEAYAQAVYAGRCAVKYTKNSYITPILTIGMNPGAKASDLAGLLRIKKESASKRMSHLYRKGYLVRVNRLHLHLSDTGEKVFSAVMPIVEPHINEIAREIVKAAAKYRKEQEQRRPEKGEIVLLYDGCPPDLLTRQRKRKRKTKRVKP